MTKPKYRLMSLAEYQMQKFGKTINDCIQIQTLRNQESFAHMQLTKHKTKQAQTAYNYARFNRMVLLEQLAARQ